MGELFRFPNPVNEVSARLVAGGVVVIALVALVGRQPWLLVPLVGHQHFLRGIAGINKAGGGEFTESDLHLLELFAGQAAIIIHEWFHGLR